MSILDSKTPKGPLADKWTKYKNEINLVNPANKRNIDVIVVGTGLAGGSADAAATIRGLNRLFKLDMNLEKMAKLGVGFGADVPFCVYNKLAVVKGIGEDLQFLNTKIKTNVLLVNPKIPVLTKTVFENLDSQQFGQKNYAELIEGLKDRDISRVINKKSL